VPDLPALAAWCLLLAIQDGSDYALRDCNLCGVPYLAASTRSRYCRRLRPEATVGKVVNIDDDRRTFVLKTTTCLEAAKAGAHRDAKRQQEEK
jgi:hypothetical protein